VEAYKGDVDVSCAKDENKGLKNNELEGDAL